MEGSTEESAIRYGDVPFWQKLLVATIPGLFLIGLFVAFAEYRVLILVGFLLLAYLIFGHESVITLDNDKRIYECRRGFRGLRNVERGSFDQLKGVELGYSFSSDLNSTTRNYAAKLHFNRPFSTPFELFTCQSLESFFESVRKLRAQLAIPVYKSDDFDKETNSLKNLDELLCEENSSKQ